MSAGRARLGLSLGLGLGNERALTRVCTRHAGPRQRVVLWRVQTEHVARLYGDELIYGQVDLMEAQFLRSERRLTHQRVEAAATAAFISPTYVHNT